MSKAEQFLWAVQTLILLNANLRAHDADVRKNHPVAVSAVGHISTLYSALNASGRIPPDMNAADAAKAFYVAVIRGEGEMPGWLHGV